MFTNVHREKQIEKGKWYQHDEMDVELDTETNGMLIFSDYILL